MIDDGPDSDCHWLWRFNYFNFNSFFQSWISESWSIQGVVIILKQFYDAMKWWLWLWSDTVIALTSHRSQVTEHSSVPMPGLLAMTNHKADPTSIVTFIDKLAKRDMAIQSLPTALVVALSKMDKGAVAAAGGTTDWSDDDYQTYVIWHTSPLSDWTACHCCLHFAFHLVMSSMLLHSVESACQWVQCPLVLGNHSSSNISSRWFCLNEVAFLVSG